MHTADTMPWKKWMFSSRHKTSVLNIFHSASIRNTHTQRRNTFILLLSRILYPSSSFPSFRTATTLAPRGAGVVLLSLYHAHACLETCRVNVFLSLSLLRAQIADFPARLSAPCVPRSSSSTTVCALHLLNRFHSFIIFLSLILVYPISIFASFVSLSFFPLVQ